MFRSAYSAPQAGNPGNSEPAAGLWERLHNPSYMDSVSRWLLAVLFMVFCITFLVYNLK